MVRGAPKLTAVSETQAHDRLDAVTHESDRPGGDYPLAGLPGGGPVGVHVELLTSLAALDQLADRQESERRVHARVSREARIRRVDPPAVRARVPAVDRRVVLHARVRAAPGGLGDLSHQLACAHRLANRFAGRAREQAPLAVFLDRAP